MPIIGALEEIDYNVRLSSEIRCINTLPKYARDEVPVCPHFQLLCEVASLIGLSGEDEIAEYLSVLPFCGVTLNAESVESEAWVPVTFCDFLRRVYTMALEIFTQRREFIIKGFDYEFDDEGNLKIITPSSGMDTDQIPSFLRNIAGVLEFQQLYGDATMADYAPEDIEESLTGLGNRIAGECFGFEYLADFTDYEATNERLKGDAKKARHYVHRFRNFEQWLDGKTHYRTTDHKCCPQMPFRMAGLRY